MRKNEQTPEEHAVWLQEINNRKREKMMQKYFDILPPRVAHLIKNNPRPKNVRPMASYYIHGPAGNGKTVYACQILIEGMHRHYDEKGLKKNCLFVTAGNFMQQINNAVATGGNMYEILENYQTADFLIFDDLGTTKMTDHAYQMLLLLVNHRYDYLLPTVFTSNYAPTAEELGRELDERLVSRIARMCDAVLEKKHWKEASV